MSKSSPLTPIKKYTMSSVEIFIIFITFSIISSMWTNIGTMILKKYLPDPSKSSLWTAISSTVIITIIFSIILSYMGLSFTNFD